MPKLAINQASAIGWPFERSLTLFADLGAEAVSLQVGKVKDVGVPAAQRMLKERGLRVASILSVGFFRLDDPNQWPDQLRRAQEGLELAAAVEAECAVLISGPSGQLSYEEAEQRFLDVLASLFPSAERLGIPLVLEPNHALRPDLGYVHTFHDALDLAGKVSSPLFGVCFEINNAWIERRLYENIQRRVALVGLVQINDYKVGTTSTPARLPLGDGDIPIERILNAFEAAGYTGYYDLEALGPDIEAMGYEEAARRSLAWWRERYPQAAATP